VALFIDEALPQVHVTHNPQVRKLLEQLPGVGASQRHNGFGRGKHVCPAPFCDRDDVVEGQMCKQHQDIEWHKLGRDAYHAEVYGDRASKIHQQATANDTMMEIRNGHTVSHRAPVAELVAA
jgi:hypothetical protein